ncbi:titin-like [Penaeus monodon]|uniref:titin-like n=1 Tax=Penaeus monodon TaxID=6687 RepID=UPI0018A7E091|nr:titin-like [Penaeus monodon]
MNRALQCECNCFCAIAKGCARARVAKGRGRDDVRPGGPASSETLPTLTLRPIDLFVVPTPILTPDAEPSTPPPRPLPSLPPPPSPPPAPPAPRRPPSPAPGTTSSVLLSLLPATTTARPTRRLIFSIKFPPRFRPSLPPRTSATSPPFPPSRGGPPRFHLDDLDDGASGEARRPQFVTRNRTTTQVYLGTTASLDCVVKNVINESVSWMRRVGDMLELLTWDTHTYASDVRYSLERHEGNRSQKWKLVIRDVQLADQGQYRCQVSTQIPMVISVTLNVTEPRARVVDERGTKVHEKHYNSGSMIELKCEIESVPFPPAAVSWRRDATLLSFQHLPRRHQREGRCRLWLHQEPPVRGRRLPGRLRAVLLLVRELHQRHSHRPCHSR